MIIGNIVFFKENIWEINSNYYIGVESLPISDTTDTSSKSKALKDVSLKQIFFYNNKVCDYSNINKEILDINCFKPKKESNESQLYQQGTPSEVTEDIIGEARSKTSPSIGVF